ncbi:hypothetical protein B0T16DRAFT_378278 [Cercophora newfieldiana]|uniref:Glycoside hydrolase family 125 protein n=1 Tax=Cercophora newfieldiana TaxID=92897 RepID=A0AA39Y1P6_9PEZI|nr:hypothetical protein B0T16DRAFT_378278 [Cercophora newfieldiana]
MLFVALALFAHLGPCNAATTCPDYAMYARDWEREPISTGRYQLSWQRPSEECRTFVSDVVDSLVQNISSEIYDPDLARLWTNTFPNTLDTTIKWLGLATNSTDEIAFVVTGDIHAMWLRDSANQMLSYSSLLKDDPYGIAMLFRGVIGLQSRYILESPYCNSFQPPVESGLAPTENSANDGDFVKPPVNDSKVFECKYELDSLAAFLRISNVYYNATNDYAFFGSFANGSWPKVVEAVVATAKAMMTPTYGEDGFVLDSPYMFDRYSRNPTETLSNGGVGEPVANGTGLIRSAFRPSDDSTMFQFNIPSNMMFATQLAANVDLMAELESKNAAPVGLAQEMKDLATTVRDGIEKHGVVELVHGNGTEKIYAYEIDGFGSWSLMDDANIPSLLSAPLLGYLDKNDATYQRTRARILSSSNPYFMRGPRINAVGGPHIGPGMAWPMASIVRIMTTDDDDEIYTTLKELLSTTNNFGLMHESVSSFFRENFTRYWFAWANGLFGEMILDLHNRKPEMLKRSFQ